MKNPTIINIADSFNYFTIEWSEFERLMKPI